MPLNPTAINRFLFFKLPAAYLCGVRVKSLSDTRCLTTVRYSWINQNPFKSMFWAVQGMAAELSTGALVMSHIRETAKPISMLVVANSGSFYKKARGRITFSCVDGELVRSAIATTLGSGEGICCKMRAVGKNESGETVSEFEFEWSLRLKMS